MKLGSAVRGVASAVLAGVLGACVNIFGAPVPDDPGLYAVQGDGKYMKLNGDPKWERETWAKRADLSRGVRFILVHPSLADHSSPAEAKVRLLRVGWVRSEIAAGGEIGPIRGPQWVAPRIEGFDRPLRFTHVDGEPRAIGAAPQGGRLEPGLYSLHLDTGRAELTARFGVGWPGVDRKQYAAANCLDRYVDGDVPYRPCSDQQLATLGQGLRVYLVPPDRQRTGGEAVLVLKGVIVNVSDRPRPVPMLEAGLRDRNGQILHRWRFAPPVERLSPGESASFRAVTREMPRETANAFVNFASHAPAPPSIAGN